MAMATSVAPISERETLFVAPIRKAFGLPNNPLIQVMFTVFTLLDLRGARRTVLFAIAVVFDWTGAILAFFVLRRMAVPAGGERPTTTAAMQTAPAAASAE